LTRCALFFSRFRPVSGIAAGPFAPHIVQRLAAADGGTAELVDDEDAADATFRRVTLPERAEAERRGRCAGARRRGQHRIPRRC
jgi:hypothetical protein